MRRGLSRERFVPRPQRRQSSGLAVGMYWATRISGIGFEMAVPAGIGFWLDRLWGTSPWLVVVGACLGFAVAMLDIVKLARQIGSRDSARGPAREDRSR